MENNITLVSGKIVKNVTINDYIKPDGEMYSLAFKGNSVYAIVETTPTEKLWKKFTTKTENRISINDFSFKQTGYGHYRVTYTSPKTNKQWSTVIDNMHIIDRTKNADEPLVKDLNLLKYIVKKNNSDF